MKKSKRLFYILIQLQKIKNNISEKVRLAMERGLSNLSQQQIQKLRMPCKRAIMRNFLKEWQFSWLINLWLIEWKNNSTFPKFF